MYVKYLSVRCAKSSLCVFLSQTQSNVSSFLLFSFIFVCFFFHFYRCSATSTAALADCVCFSFRCWLHYFFFFVFSLAVYLFLYYFSFNSLLPFHFAYIKRSLPARALVLSPSLFSSRLCLCYCISMLLLCCCCFIFNTYNLLIVSLLVFAYAKCFVRFSFAFCVSFSRLHCELCSVFSVCVTVTQGQRNWPFLLIYVCDWLKMFSHFLISTDLNLFLCFPSTCSMRIGFIHFISVSIGNAPLCYGNRSILYIQQ